MNTPLVVRLVRHAETASYDFDAGLTGRGREQARERAVHIAETLPYDAHVDIAYAPTERARETAQVLHEVMQRHADHARLGIGACTEDSGFRNLQVTVDGLQLEPTQARSRMPAGGSWAREAEAFWASPDPMGHWMSTPMLSHESPQRVVLRFLSTIVEHTEQRSETTHLIVATHSGCMRALVAWAACEDLGEPNNVEEIQVQAYLDSRQCRVVYREQSWTVAMPGR